MFELEPERAHFFTECTSSVKPPDVANVQSLGSYNLWTEQAAKNTLLFLN